MVQQELITLGLVVLMLLVNGFLKIEQKLYIMENTKIH
jgi:hypothetical protein